MKFKLSTILMLVLALAMAGGIYVWERQRSPESEEGTDSGEVLFDLKEDDITALTISQPNQPTLSVKRAEQGWTLDAPEKGPADEATVTFLVNLLATERAARTLEVAPADLKNYGLEQPVATVQFQLKDDKSHTMQLGAQTFDFAQVYAQIDPDTAQETQSVALIPTGFLDAVNRPLADWKEKPPGETNSEVAPEELEAPPLDELEERSPNLAPSTNE